MLRCACQIIGQELDAASVSWREMPQDRLDHVWVVLLDQPVRVIGGLGSGLLRGLSAFQSRPDYRGLAPLFGPEGFCDTRMEHRRDILALQYNLHRLLLHLAFFPPGTVCWEDVLLGRHSRLDTYAFRCIESGTGFGRYRTRQSYRVGAPSDGVTFGGDGYVFMTQVVTVVTDIIFQAQRLSGNPLESLEHNVFFGSVVESLASNSRFVSEGGQISDRMRGYIGQLARGSKDHIPQYVLRS